VPSFGPPEILFLVLLAVVVLVLRHLSAKYLSGSTRRKVFLGGLFILIPVLLFNRIDTARVHDAVKQEWREAVLTQFRANGLDNLVWYPYRGEENAFDSDTFFQGGVQVQSLGNLSNDLYLSCAYERSGRSWNLVSESFDYVDGTVTVGPSGLPNPCPEVLAGD
jgi:hypothetical protein